MLWLYNKLFPENLQSLTLAKGHCANTVRHLMSEESINAVDTTIAFGEGRSTRGEDITDATYVAYAYAYAAYATYAYAYAHAKDAVAAYVDAKKKHQKETADICRKYLTADVVTLYTKFSV